MKRASLVIVLFFLSFVCVLKDLPTARVAEAAGTSANPSEPVSFDFDPSVSWGRDCAFPGLKMSPDARILLVMSDDGPGPITNKYLGAEIQITYEFDGGHQYEARLARVAVDWPDEPLILILNTRKPTIWQLGFTLESQIEGVLVSGEDRQIVVGLPPRVPLLNSSGYNQGPCGYSIPHNFGHPGWGLGRVSQKLFGREPDQFFKTKDGYALLSRDSGPPGRRLYAHEEFEPTRYCCPGTGPAGEAGLQHALDQGLIRPANEADRRQWLEARARNAGVAADRVKLRPLNWSTNARPLNRAEYVILSEEFVFPAGLTDYSYAPVFYLPVGVALPRGDPDGSRVLFLEDGRCLGTACSNRLLYTIPPHLQSPDQGSGQ